MRFKSKVDWWFRAIAAVFAVLPVYMLIKDASGLWVTALILGVVDLMLILPTNLLTYYTMEDDCLLIRSGVIVSERVAYTDIVSFRKSSSMLSAPAPSAKRVEVRYLKGNGNRSVLISPANRQDFLDELEKRTGLKAGEAAPSGGSGVMVKAILMVAVLAFAAVVLFTDSVEVDMNDTTLAVSVTMAGSDSVAYEDITGLELRDSFDAGTRQFGVGLPKLSAGSFSNAEFGAYKLFVLNDVPCFIVVHTADHVMVFNMETVEATRGAYDALRSLTSGQVAAPAA